jgi:rhodanese-related sulfurtransferase
VSVAVALCLVGCNRAPEGDRGDNAAQATRDIPQTPLTEVQKLVETKSATVLDANDNETRKEYGIVPGAKLLSSSDHYALSELPADKSAELVFYCGGMKCRASDHAAKRAAEAGYKQVSVMREGIRGWKAAGAPTEPLPQS